VRHNDDDDDNNNNNNNNNDDDDDDDDVRHNDDDNNNGNNYDDDNNNNNDNDNNRNDDDDNDNDNDNDNNSRRRTRSHLELQRSLQGDGEVVAAAEEQEAARKLESATEVKDEVASRDDGRHLRGQLHDLVDAVAVLLLGEESALVAQQHRHHREHEHLAGERLGGRDADLRTDVQVHAGVRGARDAGAHLRGRHDAMDDGDAEASSMTGVWGCYDGGGEGV
jgi:hypothetical protein